MDIISKLNEWKSKTNGEFTTFSTITIKTETMNMTVTGRDLEDAFKQIEAICEKKEEQVSPATTFQQNQPTQPVMQNTNTSKSIQELLNGKQLVRIHGTEALAPGESLFEYNGLTYVVR